MLSSGEISVLELYYVLSRINEIRVMRRVEIKEINQCLIINLIIFYI